MTAQIIPFRSVSPIPVAHLERIFGETETDPAHSLLASATTFEVLGKQYSADFCRDMAADAAVWPDLYRTWAQEQAERALKLSQGDVA